MLPFAIETTKIGAALPPEASAAIRQRIAEIPEGARILVSILPVKDIPGALDVMPFNVLCERYEHMQRLASVTVDHRDPNALLDALNDMGSYIAISGHMLASAKYYLHIAKQSALGDMPEHVRTLSANERRDWASAQVAQYEMIHSACDRINASLTHRCDHIRSFIAYLRAEIGISNSMQNVPSTSKNWPV